MKRIIEFQVEVTNSLTRQPDSQIVRIEFDWNEKDDVLKVAEKTLDSDMNFRGYEDYSIDYWWWIE